MDRPPTWQQKRERWDADRRTPESLTALADSLVTIGHQHGLAAVGLTDASPFDEARRRIEHHVASGLSAGMGFTFRNAERSTTPSMLLPDASTLVVGALGYRFEPPEPEPLSQPAALERGVVARYQWVNYYERLRSSLNELAVELKRHGWRARVLADDNVLVDRAAAYRAGIGWFGKNANLLLPGLGSWFVLGAVVTDAPLPTAATPVADGCGACTRCIPACPTDAIVEPGVIDGRRCLAWLVQSPDDIPEFARIPMGARVYGCDDCQEVCPENRLADRRTPPRPAAHDAISDVDLRSMLESSNDELLAGYGQWWLPDRDPDILRRNAAVALGNIGDPNDRSLIELLQHHVAHGSPRVRLHARWSLDRLHDRAQE